MAEQPKFKTHPVTISPYWLHGPCTIHEVTTDTAKKIAKASGCPWPLRLGWYLSLPTTWTWSELHHNPENPKRPYHVIHRP